ncbi:MAG: DNA repair protein RecO, partial [Chitinophagales bacterium]
MLVKTEALILKTTKFRETSLIVKAYTQSHGVLSFIVNGVRTAKKTNKAVLFQPLNYLDIIVYYKENKGLLHLKEYKFNMLYQEIPFNIVKSSLAILMLEVVEHIVKEEEENDELYDFLKNAFVTLDLEKGNIANYHLYFLASLTSFIGINAQGKYSEKTPYFNMNEGRFSASSKNFNYLQGRMCENFSLLVQKTTISINKAERKALLDIFLSYYKIHIDDFRQIKSVEVLE